MIGNQNLVCAAATPESPHDLFRFDDANAVLQSSIAGVTLVHLLRIAIARAQAEKEKSASLAASVTADLVGMTRLNELSSLLVREGKELKTRARRGDCDHGRGQGKFAAVRRECVALSIAAQRGFEATF